MLSINLDLYPFFKINVYLIVTNGEPYNKELVVKFK